MKQQKIITSECSGSWRNVVKTCGFPQATENNGLENVQVLHEIMHVHPSVRGHGFLPHLSESDSYGATSRGEAGFMAMVPAGLCS